MKVVAENWMEYFLIEYRWVIVITALLPMSVIWKLWFTVRNYVVFKMNSAPKMHDEKVKGVQRQIKAWLAGDRSTRLCTARPTWQTMSFRHSLYKKTFTNIEVNLMDVLEVDTTNMTVRCEPLVTMGQLSRTLEPLGLALPVVPELDQLTVGGLVMGTGVETSSHVHGLFQHICLQFELVLADGSVVTCSKDENADLFYAVPWSHGTLGFLTSVVIKVIPAQKYVRVQYYPCTNLSDLLKRFNQESTKPHPHQFVEALVYTKDTGVLMLGDMVDEVGRDGKLNEIGNWHGEWFYKQVEKHLKRKRSAVEYIPLRDYYHRHTRSLFWELQPMTVTFLGVLPPWKRGFSYEVRPQLDRSFEANANFELKDLVGTFIVYYASGDIIPFGNNVIFRYLFGWLMPPEISLLKLTQPEAVAKLYERAHVFQDMLVPVERLEKALDLFHDEFEVYPIWLCPFKVFNNPGLLKVSGDSQMFVDIGVYGVPKAKGYETVPSIRRVEKFVIENKGFQMLYADTYTTEEEFRQMFDHSLYDKVRNSLPHCKEAFPEIYGKVNRSVRK